MASRRSHRRRSNPAAWVAALVASAIVIAVLFTAQQHAAREQDRREAEAAAKAAHHPTLSARANSAPAPFTAPPESSQAVVQQAEQETTGPAHFDVPSASPGLELLDHHPEPGKYCWYILGRIRNDTDAAFGYVRVRADVYDAARKRIGTASDSTTNLAAHEVWHFKILIDDPDARGYRITGISDAP